MADTEVPLASFRIPSNVPTNVVTSIHLPGQNPIEAGFLPQFLLQVFPAIFEKARPGESAMKMQPAPDFAKLVCDKKVHAAMDLLLNPLNHSGPPLVLARKEMVDKVRIWLRLLNGKAPSPGKFLCSKGQC
jgi:hypothetical protein